MLLCNLKKLKIGSILLLIGIILLLINLYGIIFPNDYRKILSQKYHKNVLSYNEVIKKIDESYLKYRKSKKFLKQAVKFYNEGIFYVWPTNNEFTTIPLRENFILYFLHYFDYIFYKYHLTNIPDAFSKFETHYYEKALRRGFGICSQNAEGLADLLYKRYGIETHIIGLLGHVILEAKINNKNFLLDPSVGLFIPMNLEEAENNLSGIKNLYKFTTHPELAVFFNKEGNVVSPIIGGSGQRPTLAKIETISYILKWLLPIIFIIFGLYISYYRNKKCVE